MLTDGTAAAPADDASEYQAPAVAAVTPVGKPLIGTSNIPSGSW